MFNDNPAPARQRLNRLRIPYGERGPLFLHLGWVIAVGTLGATGNAVATCSALFLYAVAAFAVRRYRPDWLGVYQWQEGGWGERIRKEEGMAYFNARVHPHTHEKAQENRQISW